MDFASFARFVSKKGAGSVIQMLSEKLDNSFKKQLTAAGILVDGKPNEKLIYSCVNPNF